MRDLFLSHASEDKEELVRPVADELMRRGLSVWLDEAQIFPGLDFVDAIQRGMKDAHAVVVFLSPSFLSKRWPLKELNNFVAMGKPLIPVVSDLSISDVLETFPLLSSTYMMIGVRDCQEIARRIVRAYDFMRAPTTKQRQIQHIAGSVEACRGTITHPADGSSVDRHILAEGTILYLPESAWLFLVVEVGGLKWPKDPGLFVSGNAWTGEAYEGGTPPHGRFTLSLYVVPKAGFDEITDWTTQGHRSGSYPGLSVIRDARRLDSVELQLRQTPTPAGYGPMTARLRSALRILRKRLRPPC